jgi:hypothetical protein
MCLKDILEIVYWGISLGILFATVYYIATGPLNAVKTGRQLNLAQQKDNAKRNLFLMLFSLRGSPINYDFVRGLNQIDVVFEDVPKVLEAWRIHRDSLDIKDQANRERNWELQRTHLLSEMAVSLGYTHLNETHMMKDYYPEGHQYQLLTDQKLRASALEFFEKGSRVYDILIQNNEGKTGEKEPPKPAE